MNSIVKSAHSRAAMVGPSPLSDLLKNALEAPMEPVTGEHGFDLKPGPWKPPADVSPALASEAREHLAWLRDVQCIPAELSNRPLALTRDEADLLAAAMRGQGPAPSAFGFGGSAGRERQYGLIDGIAIIPVNGILFQGDVGWGWATGYKWIRTGFEAALVDPEVQAILFDVNSPGGEVAGCFDLVDTIYAARGAKPIWSVLSECAYSAAYAIASAADTITVPRTGGTGSVGVIWMQVDWSQALDRAGIKVTFLTYGEHKADGHPELPLSDGARARFQKDIDSMGDLFVRTVARNRGIDAEAVRNQQAALYLGNDGVAEGLADAVMAPDAAFRALLSCANGGPGIRRRATARAGRAPSANSPAAKAAAILAAGAKARGELGAPTKTSTRPAARSSAGTARPASSSTTPAATAAAIIEAGKKRRGEK
ncbi:S49 family peptidase [Azospirillum argentinense]|uniref:S49 family peptidase n=1 Tax=Azospirillum argentinense TaxID=2970906 RepID=UPI001FFE7CE7|nr:S49 family peptidase [Azospirillum argentinense]